MNWIDNIVDKCPDLLAGTDISRIREVEMKLRVTFPQEFVNFLQWRDGGQIAKKCYIIYSAGNGIHPEETLLSANENRELEIPFLFIGRDAEEEFGFKKSDLGIDSPPIYFYCHEDGKLDKVADSFQSFIMQILSK